MSAQPPWFRGPRHAEPNPTRMQNFRQLDYLHLDDSLSDEEKMVRDTVRTWVSERYLPLAMEQINWIKAYRK